MDVYESIEMTLMSIGLTDHFDHEENIHLEERNHAPFPKPSKETVAAGPDRVEMLWPFDSEPDDALEQVRRVLETALADIGREDRLGNHEIQRLMQIMNQNDTLEATIRKKDDDRENAISGKI